MPQFFIYETAVTIDHETGEARVDTTRVGIASRLKRCKFQEVTREDSKPYRRFIGQADQVTFRRPKAERVAGRTFRGFDRKIDAGNTQESGLPEK